jgi:MSHA biogenesis protein MshE
VTEAYKRIKIGDLLVEQRIISESQLSNALAAQKMSGLKLGQILIDNNYIDEDMFLNFLSSQFHIPYVELNQFELKPDIVSLLPESLARKYRAVVISETDKGLLVGMTDPSNMFIYDNIHKTLKQHITLALVSESDLLDMLDKIYASDYLVKQDTVGSAVQSSSHETDNKEKKDPIIQALLKSVFGRIVEARKSDIQLEFGDKMLRIRIDGMHHSPLISKQIDTSQLAAQVRLSGLDISATHLPQTGHIHILTKDHFIEVIWYYA